MLKSIVEDDSIDFIWSSFSMLPARFPFVDFLPPLSKEYGGIFIPNQDSVEKIQYNLFLEPFSMNVWVAILVTDLIIGCLILTIQWLRTSKTLVIIYYRRTKCSFEIVDYSNFRIIHQVWELFGLHLWPILVVDISH